MTLLYDLNQPSSSLPFAELKQDHHPRLFISPHRHHASASLYSGPTFFNTATQDQRGSQVLVGESSYHHDHEIEKFKSNSRWGDHIPLSPSCQIAVNDNMKMQTLSPYKRENEDYNYGGHADVSEKWMPLKMRLMQKMMNSTNNCSQTHHNKPMKFTLKFQDHQQFHHNHNCNSNNVTRVCSDCNTITTPLWRSGPRGPKRMLQKIVQNDFEMQSLCNACGIRQRKARRAMVAAAAMGNGIVVAMETSSEKAKFKEKKARTSQCKKLCKQPSNPDNHSQKLKISLKNLALSLSKSSGLQGVVPPDVEQAARLLMELSCGFHS